MHLDERALHYIRGLPCDVCGRKPSHGNPVKPFEHNGPHELFNLFPLCVTHCVEHLKIGTIDFVEKYPTVKKSLKHRGWTFGKKMHHKKLIGEI